MKKFNITLILFLCINLLFAQNPLVKQWDKRFGGTDAEFLTSFQQTFDGGLILGGISYSGNNGDKTQALWDTCINCSYRGDYWIVKVDTLGIRQWDRSYGGTFADHLNSIQQTSDGGYILGGSSLSEIGGDKSQPTQGGFDYWIVKTDLLGIKQWDKRFGGGYPDHLYSIQQTPDGGYILGGSSSSGNNGDKTQANWDTICVPVCTNDYWIVKIDAAGNMEWDKRYGGIKDDFLYSLQQTSDGGYLLGGCSYSPISGDKTQPNWDQALNTADFWIVRIDSVGNKLWDKRFGGTLHEEFRSMNPTNDSGFVLAGISYSGISGDKTQPNWGSTPPCSNYWMVKIDEYGNKLWDKRFGGICGETVFGKVVQTSDKGYLLSGTSYALITGDKTEFNLGVEQSWIIKTDSLGLKEWDKTLFTQGHDEQGLAIQMDDGCYAIANMTAGGIGGYKTQPNWDTLAPLSYDYWLIKFCDTTSTAINELTNFDMQFWIYPNPVNSTLTFSLTTNTNILIINLLGEIIFSKNFSNGKNEIDISYLSSGIYFVKAGNQVRKFIKE